MRSNFNTVFSRVDSIGELFEGGYYRSEITQNISDASQVSCRSSQCIMRIQIAKYKSLDQILSSKLSHVIYVALVEDQITIREVAMCMYCS